MQRLFRAKPFLQQEIEDNVLGTITLPVGARDQSAGNPATEALLHQLKPAYWFAAHHHVKVCCVRDGRCC